jgi:protein-disulfide isomerase
LSRKQIIAGLVVLVLLGLGVAAYVAWSSTQNDAVTAAGTDAPGFTLVPSDRTLGNPKAKVTLIEYAAPSCPVCAMFNAKSFPDLKTNYIDTGKVFYVLRIFPISADDAPAEKIARCLPEDKYFAFIDLLFRNQPKWDHEYASENPALATPQGVHDGLVLMGRIAGMSPAEVDKCIDNKAEDDRINKVAADGETRYAITGTPTLIIDGVAQPARAIPYPELKTLLDNALAKH